MPNKRKNRLFCKERMIPRGQLYISWKQLLAGIRYCLTDRTRSAGSGDTPITSNTPVAANQLICLSVRTGFDLVLTALDLPPGSEIIVTDINIPDMFNIIAGHNLTIVPIPVNKHTLDLSVAAVEAAIKPATKAILITHLFGGIMETEALIEIAKKHNLIVFEDCAQAYAGNLYQGNPASHVIMFSFGFIKTNTAASGALIQIKDKSLYTRVTARHQQYPQRDNKGYLKKLLKMAFVKLLTNKTIYTAFYHILSAAGKDLDEVLSRFTKGFPGDDIFTLIRFRISGPNRKLLQRKLKDFDQRCITTRIQLADDILKNIPDNYKIGTANKRHSYWIMPVETKAPDRLIHYLRSNGFDASQKASSLIKLPDPEKPASPEDLNLDNLVYLPVYPAMRTTDRARLTQLLISFPG